MEGMELADGLAAIMLMTSLSLVMVIFYLVNCRDPIIRKAAWSVTSTAISIFLAVMTYNMGNDLIEVIFGIEEPEDEDAPPGLGRTMSRFSQLFLWWFWVIFFLWANSGSLLKEKAYGLVSGHIMGFAAIAFFGCLAHDKPFREAAGWDLLILVFVAVVFIFLFGSSFLLRKCLAKCLTDEENDLWHDVSKDTGNDFLNMANGFVLSFFFRFLILGELPSVDGDLAKGDAGQQVAIFVVGLIFLGISVGIAAAHNKIPKKGMKHDVVVYMNGMFTDTAAFCILFGFMWTVKVNSDIMGHVLTAISCTACAIAYIFFVAFIHTHFASDYKIFKASITGLSLAVALSWEKLFDATMDDFADLINVKSETDKKLMQITVMLFLEMIIFPAWCVYIYPKTDEEVQERMSFAMADGPLPAWAVCCDAGLYNDTYDVENSMTSGVE